MTNIYEKFDKATGNITAQILLINGKPVGRIVVKFGAAATAYVQIWGAPMAMGRATGYGYDKASAAVMAAIDGLTVQPDKSDALHFEAYQMLLQCARNWNGGTRYTNALEASGFTVANAI